MFKKENKNEIVILIVFVDDILIIGNDHALVEELKGVLQKNFKIKDLNDLKYFLGMEIARSNKGIALSKRNYAL